MPVVSLRIEEPSNGTTVVGSVAVRLHGTLVSQGPPPLFYKWYSSLVGPSDLSKKPPDASIQPPAGADPLNFLTLLPVGSQVVTLAAKDVAGDTEAALKTVKNVGMAGGPAAPGNAAPCVVHVLIAKIVAPISGATLSKANATLAASGPSTWFDDDYKKVNQLQYRWKFNPQGDPPGRKPAEMTPEFPTPTPNPRKEEVRYTGALPAALSTGNYSLTLRVENKPNPAVGHEVSIPVVLVA